MNGLKDEGGTLEKLLCSRKLCIYDLSMMMMMMMMKRFVVWE